MIELFVFSYAFRCFALNSTKLTLLRTFLQDTIVDIKFTHVQEAILCIFGENARVNLAAFHLQRIKRTSSIIILNYYQCIYLGDNGDGLLVGPAVPTNKHTRCDYSNY